MRKGIQNALKVYSRFRLPGLRFLLLNKMNKNKWLSGIKTVTFPGIKHPVVLRAGTSDFKLFRNIFIDGEYDIPLPFEPKTIIDGGGNIGLAAILFANRYPDAHIVSIEPESSNYSILQKNIANYPNITSLKAGVWSKSSYLHIQNPSSGKWAFTIEETDQPGENSIEGISIDDIIARSGWNVADLVKLDIEGSEIEVFDNYGRWLNNAKAVIVETHDWFKPGSSASVEHAIKNFNFSTSHKGENTVYVRH